MVIVVKFKIPVTKAEKIATRHRWSDIYPPSRPIEADEPVRSTQHSSIVVGSQVELVVVSDLDVIIDPVERQSRAPAH